MCIACVFLCVCSGPSPWCQQPPLSIPAACRPAAAAHRSIRSASVLHYTLCCDVLCCAVQRGVLCSRVGTRTRPVACCPAVASVGLARTIYIRFTYGIFGSEITKYKVYLYVYITVLANPTHLSSLDQA